MNAPLKHKQIEADALGAAREEVHTLLATVEHYAYICRLHLQYGDDPCALMAINDARVHFVRALEVFRPIREAMKSREADHI